MKKVDQLFLNVCLRLVILVILVIQVFSFLRNTAKRACKPIGQLRILKQIIERSKIDLLCKVTLGLNSIEETSAVTADRDYKK